MLVSDAPGYLEGKITLRKKVTNFEADISAVYEAVIHLFFFNLNRMTSTSSVHTVLTVCSTRPRHCEIPGNDMIDSQDKDALNLPCPAQPIAYQ